MNILFASGIQWAVWSQQSNRIIVPQAPRGKVRMTINLIKPWLLDTMAKFDIAVPQMDVLPNTSNQDDKEASVAGESAGQHYWRRLRMRAKNRLINNYTAHFGDCYGLIDWDESIGPRFQKTTRIFGGDGERQSISIEGEGDITLNILLGIVTLQMRCLGI